VYGQIARMTSGTITVATQSVYQSTGLVAVLDAESDGISLGTSDTFAIKNTSGVTRRLKIAASYDASMGGATKVLGAALAINGTVDLDTECRATTGLTGAIAKLFTSWIIDLDDGDEVALFVANFTDTGNISFQRGRVVATSVAGYGPSGVVISATEPVITDVLWADESEPGDAIIPVGGLTGQALVKVSGDDYDADWIDPYAAPQIVNGQTAAYTLLAADAGRLVTVDSASALDVTVDGSLDLEVGQRIDLLRLGTGTVTVVASGATVNGTPGLKLRARYSAATLLCVATDVYVLLGDLAA
jgi:hypothetical protein